MTVLVVVVGPQASGKSTTAAALGDALRAREESVAVVALDTVAAMALPTLPGKDVAHAIFESVVGQWARAGLSCVIAEGSGSRVEVERLLRQSAPGSSTLTAAVSTDLEVAWARAQLDQTRGASKDIDFLRGVYERWPDELDRIAADVVLDTTRLDVEECVLLLVEEVWRRRTAG